MGAQTYRHRLIHCIFQYLNNKIDYYLTDAKSSMNSLIKLKTSHFKFTKKLCFVKHYYINIMKCSFFRRPSVVYGNAISVKNACKNISCRNYKIQ